MNLALTKQLSDIKAGSLSTKSGNHKGNSDINDMLECTPLSHIDHQKLMNASDDSFSDVSEEEDPKVPSKTIVPKL